MNYQHVLNQSLWLKECMLGQSNVILGMKREDEINAIHSPIRKDPEAHVGIHGIQRHDSDE